MNWNLTLHGVAEPLHMTESAQAIADEKGWAFDPTFAIMSFASEGDTVSIGSNNLACLGALAGHFTLFPDRYKFERLTLIPRPITEEDRKAYRYLSGTSQAEAEA